MTCKYRWRLKRHVLHCSKASYSSMKRFDLEPRGLYVTGSSQQKRILENLKTSTSTQNYPYFIKKYKFFLLTSSLIGIVQGDCIIWLLGVFLKKWTMDKYVQAPFIFLKKTLYFYQLQNSLYIAKQALSQQAKYVMGH